MSIFIDSSAFIAYHIIPDTHHNKAVELLTEIFKGGYGEAYTSDYILDESVTVIAARTKRKDKAIELGNFLLSGDVNLLHVDEKTVQKTWKNYKKTDNPSFTDVSTLTLMQEHNIRYIATFDRWFTKQKNIKVLN